MRGTQIGRFGTTPGGHLGDQLADHIGGSRASRSATAILPGLQHPQAGQWVPMSPAAAPTDRTALKVHSFEANQWLVWTKPDSTWAWRLTPAGAGGTRLVTRIHAVYDWQHPLMALLGVLLMEFGDFAMLRRMLRGIKARAESLARDASRTGRSL